MLLQVFLLTYKQSPIFYRYPWWISYLLCSFWKCNLRCNPRDFHLCLRHRRHHRLRRDLYFLECYLVIFLRSDNFCFLLRHFSFSIHVFPFTFCANHPRKRLCQLLCFLQNLALCRCLLAYSQDSQYHLPILHHQFLEYQFVEIVPSVAHLLFEQYIFKLLLFFE